MDAVSRFLSSSAELVSAVADLPEAVLDCSSAPGAWSIRQIVHHVADDGDVWSMMLKKTIATPGLEVRFEGFPGNEPWANALAFDRRPIGPSLTLIQAHHAHMAQIAECFADGGESYYVKTYGPDGKEYRFTLCGILEMLTGHLYEHLATIEEIKKQQGLMVKSAE